MVRQIIQFNLTGRQVQEICAQGLEKEEEKTAELKLSPTAMRMVKLVKTYSQETPDNLARALLQEENNIHVAQAKLQAMIEFLQDVNQYLLED
jgi:hypothetical protein